jgi:HEAT repeat protein
MAENDLNDLTARIERLLSTDGWSRVRAELAGLGGAAVPILLDQVRKIQPDRKSAERAILALGEIGGDEAENSLTSLLDHEDPILRAATLTALEQIGSSRHAPAIIKLLGDADEGVRKEAISALTTLGDSASIEPLNAIARSDEKEYLKERAQNAIEEIERRRAGGNLGQ